jgi:hypothetical protein
MIRMHSRPGWAFISTPATLDVWLRVKLAMKFAPKKMRPADDFAIGGPFCCFRVVGSDPETGLKNP